MHCHHLVTPLHPLLVLLQALDLLKNVQVQAIIGPQTSTQAKFVIELGDKTHVPIISFSANNPSLSPQKSPYFIRTGLNDSSQTQVIASIIEAFKWREVVPIFEDTDYGNGIVPYLIDALQEVEARVPYRSSLPLLATKNQIMAELQKLKRMQTRVFIVHMTYSLGFDLFSYAKKADMMGQGYVWITTYGLTDLVDLMGSAATDVMQGVLGIKPYVKETNKLHEFNLRWQKKFYQGNPDDKLSEPTVFGLWAYDTVRSLALSVESAGVTYSTFQELNTTNNSTDFAKLGSSRTGPVILNHILSTKFEGMSGEFDLINGKLDSKAFEIINVAGKGKRRIGFWTPANGTSRYMDSKAVLKDIIWPGGQKAIPKGWEWPTMGNALHIGIPVKPGFSQFVSFNNGIPTGFCIDVFDAVMKQMPYHVPYSYFPFGNATDGTMNGTYDDLVYQVYLQKYDAVVGDITIIANRSLYVDFTLPYTESGVSMVVPVKDTRRKNAWTFLEPLTANLWLGSAAFFIFTGFVVWFLEHRINPEFRGTTSNQLGTIFYFAFSTLVFAHREQVVSNLSRVVVIIWVFVVLVLQSSYTASLTSMLTVQQLQPTVTDLNDLIKSGASVGYLNDSFMPALLKRLNFNETKLIAYESPEEYNDALSNGSVKAIFDEIPYLKVFLSQYCNKYTMTGPTYKTDGFGFVFPKDSPLVPDVSRAILHVTEGETMVRFEQKLYNGSCPDMDNSDGTSSSLTINSFWGLFLITGIASLSALIIYLAFFLHENLDLLRTSDAENSVGQRLASLAKVYDQMDPSRAPKKPEEAMESPAMGDIMPSPFIMSGPQSPSSISNHAEGDIMASPFMISEPQSPSSISNHANESFELEEGTGMPPDEEETPGREINRENPGPPSFAEMLTERTRDCTS